MLVCPGSFNVYSYFFSAISAFIFAAVWMGEAISERKLDMAPTNIASLWREGLGTLSDHEMISQKRTRLNATETFFVSVLAANAFQLLFSFGYFMYNGLLTCMSVASELSKYGTEHKPLRVSAPVGMQRSSYLLSLPYRLSIPF